MGNHPKQTQASDNKAECEQGYNEDFPFGDSRVMTGIIFDLDYNIINDFFVSSSISYWFQSVYDNLGANYQFSLRYEFYK